MTKPANHSPIRTFNGFSQSGISISGSGATGNIVSGNHIGTDASGTVTLGNGWDGVRIDGAQNNTVGGDEAGERNVISGNGNNGVSIYGSGATGNTIAANNIHDRSDK